MSRLIQSAAGVSLAVLLGSGATAETTWDMPTPYPAANFQSFGHTRRWRHP